MAGAVIVFISYSHENATEVERLRTDLSRAGARVWIDHEDLVPGTHDWEEAVREGILAASSVIYAASVEARKSPYVRDEINLARSKGREVIPFWVASDDWEDCAPLGWGSTQFIDGRGASYPAGLAKLLRRLALQVPPQPAPHIPQPTPTATVATPAPQPATPAPRPIETQASSARVVLPSHRTPIFPLETFPERLAALGFEAHARGGVEWIVPPVCSVPAGRFRLGSDKRRTPTADGDELHRRVVTLPDYAIGRFPVTVAEYACFVNATQRNPPQPVGLFNKLTWEQQLRERLSHPVVNVTWRDAYDYAEWLEERTGQPWHLPTEAEWEKAARCDPRDPLGASSERTFPWGDTFDYACFNCFEDERSISCTTPVGAYGPNDPEPDGKRRNGASPCGAEDMAGNVWEWTGSIYSARYSKSEQKATNEYAGSRMLRGGSWCHYARRARSAYRASAKLDFTDNARGFRLARSRRAGS